MTGEEFLQRVAAEGRERIDTVEHESQPTWSELHSCMADSFKQGVYLCYGGFDAIKNVGYENFPTHSTVEDIRKCLHGTSLWALLEPRKDYLVQNLAIRFGMTLDDFRRWIIA